MGIHVTQKIRQLSSINRVLTPPPLAPLRGVRKEVNSPQGGTEGTIDFPRSHPPLRGGARGCWYLYTNFEYLQRKKTHTNIKATRAARRNFNETLTLYHRRTPAVSRPPVAGDGAAMVRRWYGDDSELVLASAWYTVVCGMPVKGLFGVGRRVACGGGINTLLWKKRKRFCQFKKC